MVRRRTDDPFGLVDPRIPYDRTDPMQEEVPVTPLPEEEEMMPGAASPAPGAPAPGGMLAGLGEAVPPAPETTDQLSDVDLAGLAAPEDVGSPEDIQADQLEQMLADPSLSPDDRAIIEQQIALAARRRLAGVGGGTGGMLGGLGG